MYTETQHTKQQRTNPQHVRQLDAHVYIFLPIVQANRAQLIMSYAAHKDFFSGFAPNTSTVYFVWAGQSARSYNKTRERRQKIRKKHLFEWRFASQKLLQSR